MVESLGPKFVDLAKQLQENGYDGEVLADASDEDLDELFGELSVSKLQQKVLRNKLRKSLDERPAAPAVGLAGEGLLGVAKDLPWVAPVAFLIGAVVKAAQDAAALKEDAARFVRVVRSVEGALQRAAADGKLTENASIREALEEALAHCHMLAREGTCVAMLLSDSATFEALQAKLHSACEACAADTNLLVSESYDQAKRLGEGGRGARRRGEGRGRPEAARAHHGVALGGGSGHRGHGRRGTSRVRRRGVRLLPVAQALGLPGPRRARARPADGRGLPRVHRPRGLRGITEAQGQRARVGEAGLLHVAEDLRVGLVYARIVHGGRQRRRRPAGHRRGHDLG